MMLRRALMLCVVVLPALGTEFAKAGTIAVDNTTACVASPHANPYAATYCTIQDAVTDASAGDTVQVAAGTYIEDISVSKSLTLNAANAGTDPTAGPRGAETIVQGGFRVLSSGFTLDGFSLRDGVGPGGIGDITCAWLAGSTSGHRIVNNIIVGPAPAPVSGSRGVLFSASSGSNSVVQNNEISDWFSGIFI